MATKRHNRWMARATWWPPCPHVGEGHVLRPLPLVKGAHYICSVADRRYRRCGRDRILRYYDVTSCIHVHDQCVRTSAHSALAFVGTSAARRQGTLLCDP